MNYSESLRYLNSFLNLERITFIPGNRLWNLRRMQILLKWFPPKKRAQDFLPILIAGTKGKGSTGYFLESILGASRIPCGFYTSPHLEDPRERIRIRGRMVSRGVWTRGVNQIRKGLTGRRLPPAAGEFTYFEIMTLLAILLFRQAGLRIGIFEVGMGGRLDATNALAAPLVILTPINLDHEAFLGNTVGKIAAEKAAIIHRGARVVVSPQPPAAKRVIQTFARRQKAFVYPVIPNGIKAGLEGDYQVINAACAQKAAYLLRDEHGFAISAAAIQRGLAARAWPGRMEHFPGRPAKNRGEARRALWRPGFLLDAAHNPASIEALVRNLRRDYGRRRCLLIFGTSRDKNSGLMLQELSRFFPDVILTRAANIRSQETGPLLAQARGRFRNIIPAGTSQDALTLARGLGKRYDLVVVTGSFYLLGEMRPLLRH